MATPQLTIEVITGPNCVSDYDVILHFGEKYLTMKQDEVIRRREYFCKIVPKTGNEIKVIAKVNQLTQKVHKMIVRNRQESKSKVGFQYAKKIKPNSADEQVASVHSVTGEKCIQTREGFS